MTGQADRQAVSVESKPGCPERHGHLMRLFIVVVLGDREEKREAERRGELELLPKHAKIA